MKFDVKYSIEKDTETYINFIYNFKSFKHGRKNIQEILLSKLEPTLQEILKSSQNETDASANTYAYL